MDLSFKNKVIAGLVTVIVAMAVFLVIVLVNNRTQSDQVGIEVKDQTQSDQVGIEVKDQTQSDQVGIEVRDQTGQTKTIEVTRYSWGELVNDWQQAFSDLTCSDLQENNLLPITNMEARYPDLDLIYEEIDWDGEEDLTDRHYSGYKKYFKDVPPKEELIQEIESLTDSVLAKAYDCIDKILGD